MHGVTVRCGSKHHCCPTAPARKIPRSIHEGARDMARDIAATEAYVTSRRERKKVEMLFAHLKRVSGKTGSTRSRLLSAVSGPSCSNGLTASELPVNKLGGRTLDSQVGF